MKVLVLNCGSSSIKYKLYEMTTKRYRKNRFAGVFPETDLAER